MATLETNSVTDSSKLHGLPPLRSQEEIEEMTQPDQKATFDFSGLVAKFAPGWVKALH